MNDITIEPVTFPGRLDLHNNNPSPMKIYQMYLEKVNRQKFDVPIEDPARACKLFTWTTESRVCDAVALLGFTLEIVEPKSKAYLESCKDAKVSMTLDDEDVLINEPLKNLSPFYGKGFLEPKALFQAFIPQGERLGIFMPHGTVVEAKISGLAKTRGHVDLRVTIETATYTTKV